MRIKILLMILVFTSLNIFAQNDCPSYPVTGKFDTLTYIPANVPTDPAKGTGIFLGQGVIHRGLNDVRPAFIPSSHPTWAISIAVAWNYTRNILNRVEYPQIGYWLATVVQETQLACVTGTTWDDPARDPGAIMANATTIMNQDGCFQIEGPGSAYGQLTQNYPLGRFPQALHPVLIKGPDNFETSAMVKSYFDVYTTSVFNNQMGWDIYESVDCSGDPLAYLKTSASGYNGGLNGFLNNSNFFDGTASDCWSGLSATTPFYARDVARWTAVLEDMQGYCDYPDVGNGYPQRSEFVEYYNEDMTVQMFWDLIDKIDVMYPDVDWVEVKQDVQTAFDKVNGGAPVPFMDAGPIVDAIVLALPRDFPQVVEGSPVGVDIVECSGNKTPYGSFEILNGSNKLCVGESVTLNLKVEAGGGTNTTFRWFDQANPANTLATTQSYTYTPTQDGEVVLGGQICNDGACFTVNCNTPNPCSDNRNPCGVKIEVEECSTCNFVAVASSTNTPCKGMADGSIQLDLVNDPANYNVRVTGTTPLGQVNQDFDASGDEVNINNLRDGSYNIVLTDLNDPDCKAFATVQVEFDTPINEYLDAEILSIADCNADVEANIKELPAPCTWKVQAYTPNFFQWENLMNLGVTTSTGLSHLDKYTRVAPAGEIDPWNTVQLYETFFELSDGESMTFETGLSTYLGAQQMPYQIYVYDQNDVQVYQELIPAGATDPNTGYTGGTYTVTCPQDVPDYTFDWSPAINNEDETTTRTWGDIDVTGNDRTYVVTAINNDNPQCILRDSVVIIGDPDCSSGCADPGVATLVDVNDDLLSDTIRICTDTLVMVNLANGDNGTFKYELFKDDTPVVPTNTSGEFLINETGTYYVKVFDDLDSANTDCHVLTDELVITDTNVPNPTAQISGNDSICVGDSTLIEIELTGESPWRLKLNIDGNISFVDNITNNTYSFYASNEAVYSVDSVYDANAGACGGKNEGDGEVDLKVIPLPQLTFQDDIISQCLSQYPYEIEGPDGMDSYTWEGTGNENTRFFNATDSGWVKLTVDSLGCTASDSLFMDVIPTPVFTLGNDTTLCDLGYPFDITGPANMDAYLWEGVGNANNNIFTVTDSGWVKLTVDSAGCSYSDSLLVQTAAEIAIDLGNDTTQCEGSVVLAAGNGYDSYLWNNDATETNPTYEATASGDYFVRVTNAQGCIGRDTLTVTINDNPTIDLGDTITICPTSPPYEFDATTAGATYEWQDGSTNPTLTSDVEAWYWVEVTVAGCTTRDSAYLEVSNQLQVNIIGGDQTICPGGEAVFYSNFQNATYDWNNGASAQDTFRISTAGIVTLEVTDLGGCSGTTTAEVIIDNPLTIDLGADIDFCQGDSADLGLTPARENLNYSWNTGSTDSTLRVFTSNVYILDVDSAGCTAQSSITVTVNDLPTLDLGADTFLCTGINQTITLDAGAGFATYEWGVDASGNQPTFEITGAGTYAVRVTDNNGCENTDTINITERTATPISLMNAPKVATICPGGSYTAEVPNALQGIAGTSWEWQDGSTAVDYTVENQNDGDDVGVKLLYTNEFGCVSDDSITVRVRNNLPIAISSVEVCEGEDVTFSTNYTGADYQHEWNNDPVNNQSDFTINNVQLADAGNITVIVNSNLGCSGDTTVALTVNALPTPELTNDSLCEGESLVLNTGAAGNHLWQDGSNNNNYTINNATVSDAGVYSVIVISADNCSKDTSMELWVFATPDVEILDPPSVCEGQEVTLTTNLGMGYDFEWTGNVTTGTLEVNQNGTYEVTATDQQTGCVGTDDIELNFLTVPNVVLPADSVICEGTEWYIAPENSAALADYDIEWSTGESSIGIVVNEFGSYGLRVSNAQCESRDTVNVMVNPLPVLSLSGDTVLCFDDIGEYILNPGRSTSYLWTDGDTSSVKIVSEPGVYGVTLTDLFGCEAYGEKEIKEDCPSAVWIPNAFSPNGDGLNDRLEIMGRGVEEVGMLVFNRWGELIWEGNNVGDLWDGTHNNLPVQQDVYVYKLTYRYKDVEGILRTKERIGSVAVIR